MTETIECRHLSKTDPVDHYGWGGPDIAVRCCKECYNHWTFGVLSGLWPKIQMAEWNVCYAQARWLLAEKDAEIDELRETIEALETELTESILDLRPEARSDATYGNSPDQWAKSSGIEWT